MRSIEHLIIKRLIKNIFKKQDHQKDKMMQPGRTYIHREGKLIEADETFEAWTSGDLNRMLEQLPKRSNPIDKHFLYLRIGEVTYRQRKDKRMRESFKRIATEHVSKFDTFAEPLRRDFRGKLPRVPTFQYLATVHAEDGEYDEAVAVCEKAITFGLEDGTKTGFQGRIERIRKKMEVAKKTKT